MGETKLGRPRKHDRDGSLANLHCRLPEAMKVHWQAFVDESKEYHSLTDLVVLLLNEKTDYKETPETEALTLDDL